ncbi:MAG: hypothetical protein O3B41_11770 [Bacteroidetes bacterium]|nr:hypothetical protein [Bacteroidota bacterium]
MGHWLNLARELTEAHDNSDNSDKSPPKHNPPEPFVPFVPFVTDSQVEETEEGKIVAWINANPPDLPDAQNHCAACGEFIPVYDTGWVILGDGALIHYSGKHGKTCWDAWRRKRREEAESKLRVNKL